ncbi:MAG: carboxypeptidase regulatory-like domain-containing protein [Rhodothermales bacterium]
MKDAASAARGLLLLACLSVLSAGAARAQGVTTASMNGFVTDEAGEPLPGANVVAVHEPSGTTYGAATRSGGAYTIPNMRVGGPYTVTASYVSFEAQTETDVSLSLGQTLRLDFALAEDALELEGIEVTAEEDEVLNADRTGAATYVDPAEIAQLPSISRSTRDLTRLDPRSDGNFSFAGRNWLYNNVTLDGSYFNNPFGLDDPAPGGQAGAEPVPYNAIEQVQVSLAPFDVRDGGFTGASINQVTKSGTNQFRGTLYTFYRDENLIGNTVSGNTVVANPELTFNQVGFSVGGPIVEDKLFFFVNGELSRRDDPGANFAPDTDDTVAFGESRVQASDLEAIRSRLARSLRLRARRVRRVYPRDRQQQAARQAGLEPEHEQQPLAPLELPRRLPRSAGESGGDLVRGHRAGPEREQPAVPERRLPHQQRAELVRVRAQ